MAKKAQSILEYVVIVGVLAAALIIVGIYYQRSVQGKFRTAADVLGGGELYNP
jgi:Flp pilus assembly pilin Flp